MQGGRDIGGDNRVGQDAAKLFGEFEWVDNVYLTSGGVGQFAEFHKLAVCSLDADHRHRHTATKQPNLRIIYGVVMHLDKQQTQ